MILIYYVCILTNCITNCMLNWKLRLCCLFLLIAFTLVLFTRCVMFVSSHLKHLEWKTTLSLNICKYPIRYHSSLPRGAQHFRRQRDPPKPESGAADADASRAARMPRRRRLPRHHRDSAGRPQRSPRQRPQRRQKAKTREASRRTSLTLSST